MSEQNYMAMQLLEKSKDRMSKKLEITNGVAQLTRETKVRDRNQNKYV